MQSLLFLSEIFAGKTFRGLVVIFQLNYTKYQVFYANGEKKSSGGTAKLYSVKMSKGATVKNVAVISFCSLFEKGNYLTAKINNKVIDFCSQQEISFG